MSVLCAVFLKKPQNGNRTETTTKLDLNDLLDCANRCSPLEIDPNSILKEIPTEEDVAANGHFAGIKPKAVQLRMKLSEVQMESASLSIEFSMAYERLSSVLININSTAIDLNSATIFIFNHHHWNIILCYKSTL